MSHCRPGGHGHCHPNNAAVFTAAAAARRHHQQVTSQQHHTTTHHHYSGSSSSNHNYKPTMFSAPAKPAAPKQDDKYADIEKNMVSVEVPASPPVRKKFGCC